MASVRLSPSEAALITSGVDGINIQPSQSVENILMDIEGHLDPEEQPAKRKRSLLDLSEVEMDTDCNGQPASPARADRRMIAASSRSRTNCEGNNTPHQGRIDVDSNLSAASTSTGIPHSNQQTLPTDNAQPSTSSGITHSIPRLSEVDTGNARERVSLANLAVQTNETRIPNKPGKVQLSPHELLVFRKMRNIREKLMKSNIQREFLFRYKEANRVPQQFAIHIEPNIGKSDSVLDLRWRQTLTNMKLIYT